MRRNKHAPFLTGLGGTPTHYHLGNAVPGFIIKREWVFPVQMRIGDGVSGGMSFYEIIVPVVVRQPIAETGDVPTMKVKLFPIDPAQHTVLVVIDE